MAIRYRALGVAAAASMCLLHGQTPSVDSILGRCVAALGGRPALESVKSMVIRGAVELPGLETRGTTVEYFRYPDQFAAVTSIPGLGAVSTIYDGHTGWQTDLRGRVTEISGAELADVRRRADIHWNLRLRQLYPGLHVKRREPLPGGDAWKLEAEADNWTYNFYFDVRRGLLVRFDTDRLTNSSSIAFADYRRVGRVLFAFGATELTAPITWSQTLTDVRFNVPVDDRVFAKPETHPRPDREDAPASASLETTASVFRQTLRPARQPL